MGEVRHLDKIEFRRALGSFLTGVTIITTRDHRGEMIGTTANSFNSVSLDPPLILWSLGRHAHSMKVYLSAEFFAVNILREGQHELSRQFAQASSNKWEGVEYGVGQTGCPLLPNALAVFECKIAHTYVGGDHVIFVGEVLHADCDPEGKPLGFFRGGYTQIG
jgi:flavin reductase (DIM6/NTAB) family NADH-FMN oxidoreductase RutF